MLALSVAGYVYLHRAAPTLTEKDTIVLADFENKTGDPVFDDTLRQGLSVELQQSPFLSLISDRQVQQTLALMGQPKEARLTSEVAQQICERTASADGSGRLDRQPWKPICSWACARGTATRETFSIKSRCRAARREDVLNSLSQIARKFRTRVGESLATVEKHSTPLAEATTPSLEALKAYSTGMKVSHIRPAVSGGHPFFPRAVEIDPEIRDGLREFGTCVQRCRRVGVVGREARQKPGNCGIASAIGRGFSSTSPTIGR